MLINLSEFNPDKVEYVIIGTGPASISLAFELEKKKILAVYYLKQALLSYLVKVKNIMKAN